MFFIAGIPIAEFQSSNKSILELQLILKLYVYGIQKFAHYLCNILVLESTGRYEPAGLSLHN
nr:hypothetical protein Iba_chr09aCG5340 [Ipomoea batatas]GMD39008.1 hypothetical protein Iba_chr09fCG9490 [Ipomoea batatas]